MDWGVVWKSLRDEGSVVGMNIEMDASFVNSECLPQLICKRAVLSFPSVQLAT